MKPLLILTSILSVQLLFAQEDSSSKWPPHLWLAETLEADITWEDLKKTLPNLGRQEGLFPEAPNLTHATDQLNLLDVPIAIRFEFYDGKLTGWSGDAFNLDHRTAIGLANDLLAKFEGRFGPSTREVWLPFETDGPQDEISTDYLWHINGREFALSLNLRPDSARVGFGAYHAILVTGSYYIADLHNPTHGLLCGVHERQPHEVEIVLNPGSREKLHVLRKLHERGITGARPKRARGLADFGQTIELFGGKFTREEDGQRCLRLEGFRVRFPVSIWRETADGSRYAEVHFNMKSLFPDGIEIEGKTLDLSVFEEWNSTIRERLKP